MFTIKLTTIGTSTGAVIPKDMLNKMKVQKGDVLFVTETPGGYLLTPYDPAIEEQIRLGRQFMSDYRETFKALAE
jgi:putative addiction module antidote